MKAGYRRNQGNTNKARHSPGRRDDNVQTDKGCQGSSQRKINEQVYLTSGSGRISSTQASSLLEDKSFNGALADGGVIVENGVILLMKNHISVSKELITKVDHAIQTVSKFSNLKSLQLIVC